MNSFIENVLFLFKLTRNLILIAWIFQEGTYNAQRIRILFSYYGNIILSNGITVWETILLIQILSFQDFQLRRVSASILLFKL